MTEGPAGPTSNEPWTPSRTTRIAIGLLAGIGATGIAAGLGIVGTLIRIHVPLFDPSALILLAPVLIIPAFAAAVVGGRDVVAAITVGAIAIPVAAFIAIDASCSVDPWAGVALIASAIFGGGIAGLAAFVGEWLAASSARFERKRKHAVASLVIVGAIGVVGWVAFVARNGACQ